MSDRPVSPRPTREASILQHLGQAQLLFEQDSSPTSEQAIIHVEHARSLLLKDFYFSSESPAIDEFKSLCHDAKYVFMNPEVPYEGENAALFLSLLLPTCLASDGVSIERKIIKSFARRTNFAKHGLSGISAILDFLRQQDILEFQGPTSYRLTERGQSLATAAKWLATSVGMVKP